MREQGGRLPVRLTEAVAAADQVIRLLRTLDTVDRGGAPANQPVVEYLKHWHAQADEYLLDALVGCNDIRQKIERATREQRKLTELASLAVKQEKKLPGGAVRAEAAVRRALHLREDVEVLKDELRKAEEALEEAEAYKTFVTDLSADIRRELESLQRGFLTAERKLAMAESADRMRKFEETVRTDLTEWVESAKVKAVARAAQVAKDDSMQIATLRSDLISTEVAERIRRLREEGS